MHTFDVKKAVQILNYFAIKEGNEINCMKAFKLIWLSERVYLRKFGKLMINDEFYAMKNGPVASNVMNLLNKDFSNTAVYPYLDQYVKKISRYKYKSLNEFDADYFSQKELDILEAVYDKFGIYDKWQLSDISHKFPEWAKFYDVLLIEKSRKRCDMDFADFFMDVDNPYVLFDQTEDHIEFSKEFFEDTYMI